MKFIKQKLLGLALIVLSIITIALSIHWEEDCGIAIMAIPMGLLLIFSKKHYLTSDIEEEEKEL